MSAPAYPASAGALLPLKLTYSLQVVPGHPPANGMGVPDAAVDGLLMPVALLVVAYSAYRRQRRRRPHAAFRAAPVHPPPGVRPAPESRPSRPAWQDTRVLRAEGPVARLEDLRELHAALAWLKGNPAAAEERLRNHLKIFGHTSPWVLLELKQARRAQGQSGRLPDEHQEFVTRFGVGSPSGRGITRSSQGLLDDWQLNAELARCWPAGARRCIAYWMLGCADGDKPRAGMPVLGLQVYRDLLFLDALLGEREYQNQPDLRLP